MYPPASKFSLLTRASCKLALLMLFGCGRVGVTLITLDHRTELDSGLHAAADSGEGDAAVYAGDAEAMMSPDGATDASMSRDAGTDASPPRDAGMPDAAVSCKPSAATDSTCDGVDDDCDGKNDEDYAGASTQCGTGVCMRSGVITCVNGHETDNCTPAAATTSSDGPPLDNLDDDCDGRVDEDACDTTPRKLGPGSYPNISVPTGCYSVTVQLWGGGGASGGKSVPWSAGSSGRGGAGGYATSVLAISGALALYVGKGGASGCNAGGTNAGSNTYAGGSGATGSGEDGAGGTAAYGGMGGNAGSGGDGGRGHFGGGGGGQGVQDNPWDPPGGQGGGGGAATVFLLDGAITLAAGGGGGSGGEAGGWWGVASGGSGGDGCSGAGGVGTQAECGGGGGGGVCMGSTTHAGNAGAPYNATSLPAGQAEGATDNCGAGGDGYAVLVFGG